MQKKKTATENSGGNVIEYTTEEADGIRKDSQTFRNVIVGTDITLGEFFNKWKFGRKKGEKLEKLYLGKVSESVKQQISDLLGYDIPNRDFILTNDGVKHIFNRHGDESTEANHGQVTVDENTIEDLLETINSPDSITKEERKGTDRLIFKKQTENGDVTVVEIDNKGRATLAVKTMYINKSTGHTSAKVPVEKTTAPSWTSETT
ncbi:MAG: hypothetical protein IKU65_04215, partial [Oscillospiraceae bacterium]|nr:hypothetical protein [Oscillospiraceae bacterium]